MTARLHFRGPPQYRLRSAAEMSQSVLEVTARRMLKGPRRPGWNLFVEVATRMLKKQVNTAFKLRDLNEARRYLDSVVISSPALSEVELRPVTRDKFRGCWFSGKHVKSRVTVLFFHGGGYSFYPRAYASFIAQFTLAANSRTFALDYRLSPEHRFPAQLDDALGAYRWLLEGGTDPDQLVLAGDSAGGNLTLALLLQARDSKLPLPALAIALSPPTNFESEIVTNTESDWIDQRSLLQWRDWFCDPGQRRDPLVSPVLADLRELPPIYIQAGRAEILYDSIQAFAAHGKNQGADVVLEAWEDMNHDFQIFAPDAPQSADALRRIGEVIDARLRARNEMETMLARNDHN
jgi:epsilon-lactone hydrolase